MNLQQFEDKFDTNKKCFEYIWSQRYPDGILCKLKPECIEKGFGHRLTDSKYRCGYWKCRTPYSARTGTIFQGSRIPINKWFKAIWLISTNINGTSGLWLQKKLELGSYPTAWRMLYEIRGRMKLDKLQGTVFIDVYQKKIHPYSDEDDYIIIAVEVDAVNMSIKKIRMCKSYELREIYDSDDYIIEFVQSSIEQESTIITANRQWHNKLSDMGHILKSSTSTDKLLEPVEVVISHLRKKGLLGTPQGYCTDKFLNSYLDECCYKFNNRNSTKRFYELLEICCKY